MARPLAGVRLILKMLVRQFKELGRRAAAAGGRRADRRRRTARVAAVVLDDGAELEARQRPLVGRLAARRCGCATSRRPADAADRRPAVVRRVDLRCSTPSRASSGYDQTIVFFNDSREVPLRRSRDELVDVRSGVICSPTISPTTEPLAEGVMRITALANYDRWAALDAEAYRLAKLPLVRPRWSASAVRFVPDFRGRVDRHRHVHAATIHRFTGHDNGAVYGAPKNAATAPRT